MGIDYSKLLNFDTDAVIDRVLAEQRPDVETRLKNAMIKKTVESLTPAIEDALKVRLDRYNSELIEKAKNMLAILQAEKSG